MNTRSKALPTIHATETTWTAYVHALFFAGKINFKQVRQMLHNM